MAASIKQERNTEQIGGSPTTLTLAFSSNNVAGNATHVIGYYGFTNPTSETFTDTSNTYSLGTVDKILDDSGVITEFQSAAFNIAAGANTVKLVCAPAANQGMGLWIREIQGTTTTGPDAHTSNTSVSSTAPSINLTLVANGALISAIGTDFSANQTVTQGTGYTLGINTGWTVGAGNCAGSESENFTTSGSKAISFSLPLTDTFTICAMSFADAGGAVAAQPYAEDDRNEDEVSDEPIYAAYDSAPVGPAQPAPPVEDIQGGDELDHIEDEAAVLDAGASAPVGPAQPPLPVEDIYGEPDDLWDDAELWGADSAPVGPNQPALPVEDPAPDFEDVWDDIEIWLADSAPVGPNAPIIGQPTPDDPWNWEEIDDELDLLAAADSAPVGPNQPLLPVEDTQGEPDAVWDDVELLATFDSAPVGPNAIIISVQPPEDLWNWQDDLVDDDVDLLAAGDSAPVGLSSTLRVQAVVPGWYAEIFRDIGDVFDIAAGDLSDSSASFVPPGNPNYPLYGWMKVVPSTTPLYSYALSTEGQSSIIAGTYSITQQGTVKGLKTPRTVV